VKTKGASILLECMRKEGVSTIFGYPGGAVIPIYDALLDSPLRHILVRHEQAAAFAADGYARATGLTGTCIATSGPGATNLISGLANAYMDSVPLVAITGQTSSHLLGTDSFQEADLTGITLPITKHSYLVKDVGNLARCVREAYHIASTGRKGPVLIDLPKDVSMTETEFLYPKKVNIPGYRPTLNGHPMQVIRAAEALNRARRPLLLLGGGVIAAEASQIARDLVREFRIPCVCTLMGLGAIPGDDPLFLGMIGMHGKLEANRAVSSCDLLLAVGTRFDDRATCSLDDFAPAATVVHVDIDPAEISKNVPADIPIVGDARIVLEDMLPKIKLVDRQEWLRQLDSFRTRTEASPRESGLTARQVYSTLGAFLSKEAVVVTDVGQHQMWAALHIIHRLPRHFITSGGLGAMGYGLPAAIGVQVGKPGSQVVLVSGDGSIQMNVQELATLYTYDLPVKAFIMNNGCLGMVRQWQELLFDRRYSSVFLDGNPDFVKLAEAYGVTGLRASHRSELEDVIKEALSTEGPVLVDIRVDTEENVFPMVPPGQGYHKVLQAK